MRDLTREEVIQKHRDMWNWIADETLKQKMKVEKINYFEAMEIPLNERPMCGCYACEYCLCKSDGDTCNCKNCLVDWRTLFDKLRLMDRTCITSFYDQWSKELDYKKCAKLARKIANLPERR